MTTDQPAKVCVLCGEDCSQRPRVKDRRGRYYCRPCYDKAKEAVDARKALEETPPDPDLRAEPEPELEPVPDPEAWMVPLEGEAAPAIGCPACGRRMDKGAVICTNCGYNTRTGVTVQPRIEAPAGPQSSASARKALWPIFIGIVSIVFGAVGALLHGLDLLLTVAGLAADRSGHDLAATAAAMIMVLLSVWLAAAGIGLVLRSPRAVRSIRHWAVTKIVLYTLCFGIATAVLFTVRDAIDWVAVGIDRQPGDLGASPVMGFMVLGLAWFLLWPVFILIWFARGPVQAEVGGW